MAILLKCWHKAVIFVDHSIHSTFSTCEEKGRLGYIEHKVPIDESPPLVFGSAFHAAVASLYSNVDLPLEEAIVIAQKAFIDERQTKPGALPMVSTAGTNRRSVERGYYLVKYYAERWRSQDVQWKDITYTDKKTGEVKPYVEIGFSIYFMDWRCPVCGQLIPVVYVGKMDRLRHYRVDNNAYVWETKTTARGLGAFMEQVRPNHQLTGYKWAAKELLGLDVKGVWFDAIFVSDRKVGGKFEHGIDIEKDFARLETRRSATDIAEFLYDLKLFTERYLARRDSGLRRWHRNAPAACYMYGGCHYREACNSNLNEAIMRNKYKFHEWHPWEHDAPKLVLGEVQPLGPVDAK